MTAAEYSRPATSVRLACEEPVEEDGRRVLVDRLWPRGLRTDDATVDEWCRDIAPSAALRTWYSHDPARLEEFERRYRTELLEPPRAAALQHLREMAGTGRLTLLVGTEEPALSQAAVLAHLLRD